MAGCKMEGAKQVKEEDSDNVKIRFLRRRPEMRTASDRIFNPRGDFIWKG